MKIVKKIKEIDKIIVVTYKTILKIVILAGILFTGGLFTGNIGDKRDKKENDVLEFTPKEMMMLYQLGYIEGMNNILINQKPSHYQYQKDSLHVRVSIMTANKLDVK